MLADLRARVISAEFAPKVAALMFCENIVDAYATYSEEQFAECREAYIIRDHMRDSRGTGFTDLKDRFQNAWQGIKEEIAERCAGSPHNAQKAAGFFIGHLVSETGWCLLTRDILAEMKKVHSYLDAATMKPLRRELDVLQYRIDYLAHDPGYSPQSREYITASKREEQLLAGRKALTEIKEAHDGVRSRFASIADRAVSELESAFLSKFTLGEGFHGKMVESLSRGFQEPLDNLLEVYLQYRHDEIAQFLVKRGVLQPGGRVAPLLPDGA